MKDYTIIIRLVIGTVLVAIPLGIGALVAARFGVFLIALQIVGGVCGLILLVLSFIAGIIVLTSIRDY